VPPTPQNPSKDHGNDRKNTGEQAPLNQMFLRAHEEVYCLCRGPDIPGLFMIGCDGCNEWFHGACVGITTPELAEQLGTWLCPSCAQRQSTCSVDKGTTHRKPSSSTRNSKLRSCLNADCKRFAQGRSKYCSTTCGVLVAKQAITKQQTVPAENVTSPQNLESTLFDQAQLLVYGSIGNTCNLEPLSVADKEDLQALEATLKKKRDMVDAIRHVEVKQGELEDAIRFAAVLVTNSTMLPNTPTDLISGRGTIASTSENSTFGDNSSANPASSNSTLDIIDCITCGHPIPAKNYARHLEQCFVKQGGSGLPNNSNGMRSECGSHPVTMQEHHSSRQQESQLLCGCPTAGGQHCEKLKRLCVKHVNWESLRKSHLLQEKLRLHQVINDLAKDEHIVFARIERRHKHAEEVQSNPTIVEQ